MMQTFRPKSLIATSHLMVECRILEVTDLSELRGGTQSDSEIPWPHRIIYRCYRAPPIVTILIWKAG